MNDDNYVRWLGMIVRASLCALDWNYNVERPQKVDEFGELQWKVKVNIRIWIISECEDFIFCQVDRSGKNRTVVPILVPKDTTWQDRILDMCVDSLKNGTIPAPKVAFKN